MPQIVPKTSPTPSPSPEPPPRLIAGFTLAVLVIFAVTVAIAGPSAGVVSGSFAAVLGLCVRALRS